MPPPYEIYVHVDVLDALAKSGSQRHKILRFIESLSEHPGTLGDYTEKRPLLRDRQVKVIGAQAVTYWPDHAEKAVMIVDLKPAD